MRRVTRAEIIPARVTRFFGGIRQPSVLIILRNAEALVTMRLFVCRSAPSSSQNRLLDGVRKPSCFHWRCTRFERWHLSSRPSFFLCLYEFGA